MVLEKRVFLVYCTLTCSFLAAYVKVIHLSVKAHLPQKYNEVWERELLQQEPDPIDIFDFEEENI